MNAIDGNILTSNCEEDNDCATLKKCCHNRHGALRCVQPTTPGKNYVLVCGEKNINKNCKNTKCMIPRRK